MIQSVIKFLALLTLVTNLFLVYLFVTFILYKLGLSKSLFTSWKKLLQNKAVLWAFIVALTATLGSLFLSEIAGYEPCKFCWLQRIFMYPLVFVLGVALFGKARDVAKYVKPLSIVGGILATYHYYIQINPNALAPCTSVGFSISCSERFFTYYGYITIPWMSLTAFLLITLLMFLSMKLGNKRAKN